MFLNIVLIIIIPKLVRLQRASSQSVRRQLIDLVGMRESFAVI